MSKQRLVDFLATFGYLGLAPKGPGTVGTIGAIPVVIGLSLLSSEIYVVVTLAFCVLSIVVAQAYETDHGRHDSPEIVIDEVAGFMVTMAVLPVNFATLVVGFLLFRVLDIFKPFPVGYLDKNVKGGLGVVVDDLAAGLIANIILQALLRWQPQFFLGA